MEQISSAFSQIQALSRQGRELLQAGADRGQGLDEYLRLQGHRNGLADSIENCEQRLAGLTGLQLNPYRYHREAFADDSGYRAYSSQVAGISQMIDDIVANDRLSERYLQEMLEETGQQLKRLKGSQKAAQAYNSAGPPPSAWFIDRKK